MQAKDIPEQPILDGLAAHPVWHTCWRSDPPKIMPTVLDYMPEGVPEKVALAKMKSLIKRKLAYGCACGCRGDFRIEP